MSESQVNLNHKIYDHQPDISKADAVAWVFTEKDKQMIKYPFNFPEIKDFEVRIKILHTGLCQSDCLHARSQWGQATYPLCTGHEIVGEITKVGTKSEGLKVGEIVGVGPQRYFCRECDQCLKGNGNLCEKFELLYDPYFGGYATHIQVPAIMTVRIPEGMPLDKIPPLLCAGITVFAPIKRWFDNIAKGKTGLKVGVFGIGGLGHLALQYLNKLGCNVTAFTTSQSREKELKQMGAHQLSHSTDISSLSSQGVAHSYDFILNTLHIEDRDVFVAIQKTLKKGGHLVQVGIPPAKGATNMALDVMNLVFNQITVSGSIVASVDEMNATLQFSAQHKIYPTCEIFKFEDFNKAFDLLENGRPKFRACVNVVDWAKQNGFDK